MVQEVIHKEAAMGRTRGQPALLSQGLIRAFNQQSESDAVVQFLRAVAAYYMVANEASFDGFRHQFDDSEGSVAMAVPPWQYHSCCAAIPACMVQRLHADGRHVGNKPFCSCGLRHFRHVSSRCI